MMMRIAATAVLATLSLHSVGALAETESRGPAADANVIIYRAYAQPTAWQPTVKVDGKKIVALANRHYTATQLAPGKHIVKLSWPLLSGQRNADMQLDVKDGDRYYLEVTGISQFAGVGYQTMYFNMGSGIAQAKPEHALGVLKACCKFKAVR
jgi:Protein of unknown function (DUF2846)